MNELNLLVSTFERYCESPHWHYLQAMFRLTLKIGYDLGREQTIKNMELSKKEEKVNI